MIRLNFMNEDNPIRGSLLNRLKAVVALLVLGLFVLSIIKYGIDTTMVASFLIVMGGLILLMMSPLLLALANLPVYIITGRTFSFSSKRKFYWTDQPWEIV